MGDFDQIVQSLMGFGSVSLERRKGYRILSHPLGYFHPLIRQTSKKFDINFRRRLNPIKLP